MNSELLKIKGYFGTFINMLQEIIITDVWIKLLSF